MTQIEAESLAKKLREPELFTTGELTGIAGLFHVKARDLLTALAADERGGVFPTASVD